jgi:hypothetical protein
MKEKPDIAIRMKCKPGNVIVKLVVGGYIAMLVLTKFKEMLTNLIMLLQR